MVTIIIKSFNRPFYLDRCLQSIKICVKGSYIVKVLDDGTPNDYLDKIHFKYPEIIILKSNQYEEKVKAIKKNLESGADIDGFKIPTDLWFKEVKKSGDYVLVIEDDVWFVDQVDLDVLVAQMKKFHLPLLKLGWLGNYSNDFRCNVYQLSESINAVIPNKLITSTKFIMDLFMYNKFKFFTILYKLGVVDNNTRSQYWALNSILMGLYKKDYWLAIWVDSKGKVDEKQQLRNASVWYHKNKSAIFGRTKTEILKTTFQSSATNSYHDYGENFDINIMNYIFNKAWYNDEFDPMESYPKDFSDEYISYFLDRENNSKIEFKKWLCWVEKFRNQYKALGADVSK